MMTVTVKLNSNNVNRIQRRSNSLLNSVFLMRVCVCASVMNELRSRLLLIPTKILFMLISYGFFCADFLLVFEQLPN